jgi:hypothetical protein
MPLISRPAQKSTGSRLNVMAHLTRPKVPEPSQSGKKEISGKFTV